MSKLGGELYRNNQTGEVFRRRLLYDFGWGQEQGFELMPQLTFRELMMLIEQPMVSSKKHIFRKYTPEEIHLANITRNNFYGAVSVIMEDHVEELIDFLAEKIEMDYFQNVYVREHFKYFSFNSAKCRAEGKIPGGILTESYEDIFNKYSEWKKISSKVISKIYR